MRFEQRRSTIHELHGDFSVDSQTLFIGWCVAMEVRELTSGCNGRILTAASRPTHSPKIEGPIRFGPSFREGLCIVSLVDVTARE
jgi:hypothetical protein